MAIRALAVFLFVGERNGWNDWLKHVLYVWQEFVGKNPAWSPIRKLATPAGTYPESFSTVECTDRAYQATMIDCIHHIHDKVDFYFI